MQTGMLLTHVARGLSYVHTLFPNNQVISKEPHIIFDKWFVDANKMCDARVMYLSTCSDHNLISSKSMICTSHSKQGFKFFTTHKIDERALPVRLEGITFNLPKREVLDFLYKQTPEDTKRIIGSQQPAALPIKRAREREHERDREREHERQRERERERDRILKEERNAHTEKQNGPLRLPNFLVGHCIMPQAIEFYQTRYGTFQERLRFCKTDMTSSNHLFYEGEDGWAYEIISS